MPSDYEDIYEPYDLFLYKSHFTDTHNHLIRFHDLSASGDKVYLLYTTGTMMQMVAMQCTFQILN